MDDIFEVNDIVVVRPEYAPAEGRYPYDYTAWRRTRMKVTSVEDRLVFTEAIDPRPDLEWIAGLRAGTQEDVQEALMAWPVEHLAHAR